jgi:hypothetical protein
MPISPYIASIGLELEAELPQENLNTADRWAKQWKQEKRGRLYELHSDGSISSTQRGYTAMEFTFKADTMEEVKEFLDKMFNEYGFKTNRTMGMHMHFRTTRKVPMPEAVALLSHKPVQDEFVKEWKEAFHNKPRYVARIDKESNSYYSHPWSKPYDEEEAIDQIRDITKSGSRYHAINLNAYNLPSKTIEVRALPGMESADEAYQAVKTQVAVLDKVFKKYKTGQHVLNEAKSKVEKKGLSDSELQLLKDALEAEDEYTQVKIRE